jgi:hypothetical protein
MKFASAEEPFEMLTLCIGEEDDVFLIHRESPVGSMPARVHVRTLLLDRSVTED